MLPMPVSILGAHDWICSSARMEAKYTNPVPTTGAITVKFVQRLVGEVFTTFAPGFERAPLLIECADHVATFLHRKLNRSIHPLDRHEEAKAGKLVLHQRVRGFARADEHRSRRFRLESDKLASRKTGSVPF